MRSRTLSLLSYKPSVFRRTLACISAEILINSGCFVASGSLVAFSFVNNWWRTAPSIPWKICFLFYTILYNSRVWTKWRESSHAAQVICLWSSTSWALSYVHETIDNVSFNTDLLFINREPYIDVSCTFKSSLHLRYFVQSYSCRNNITTDRCITGHSHPGRFVPSKGICT